LANQLYLYGINRILASNLIAKTITMKKLSLLTALLSICTLSISAQQLTTPSHEELSRIDLAGRYVGKRHQYNDTKTQFTKTFDYEFELKQDGDKISGMSTIIKENGDYGDILLRGMVVGDKLYFEEYQVRNQATAPDYVWCYKYGSLHIRKLGDQIKLVGATESRMSVYDLPCTGGVTNLTKMDGTSISTTATSLDLAGIARLDQSLLISPNPYTDKATLSYLLPSDAIVTLEIYDMLGRKVSTLEQHSIKQAGTYHVDFTHTDVATGILIAKLTVNDKVYSSEMVQMK
jgi:hypothetical protein